jgi:DNA-binding transcriptional LysR family regulator
MGREIAPNRYLNPYFWYSASNGNRNDPSRPRYHICDFNREAAGRPEFAAGAEWIGSLHHAESLTRRQTNGFSGRYRPNIDPHPSRPCRTANIIIMILVAHAHIGLGFSPIIGLNKPLAKSWFGTRASRFKQAGRVAPQRHKTEPERKMRFDLLSLKLFIVVCEQQSISRTADLEHIAASAVSKRISDLEQIVKAPLFHRSQKGLDLTPAAHALLHHARIVLRDLRQMEDEMLDHAKGRRGDVRLSASSSTVVQHLPADLSDFLTQHPAIRVAIEEALSRNVIQAVSDHAADIGIFGGNLPAPGLHVVPYRSDRLVVIMPNDHPLCGSDHLTFAEMAEYDLVGPQIGSCLDSLMMRAAADLGRPLRLRIRVNGFEPAASMVEAKLGIALVPEYNAARYAAIGTLVSATLDETWAVRHWKICTRELTSLPPPVKLLLQHLGSRRPAYDRITIPCIRTIAPVAGYAATERSAG